MPHNDSFIFYRSFYDSISLAPDDEQLELFQYLLSVCLGDIEIDDVPYPYNMLINQCLYNVNTAKQRYEKATEDGAKGGRPKKWIDRQEAEKLYSELGNWKKVAEQLKVDEDTLRKARFKWYGKTEKPKNLNDNNNVNDNVNVNDNYQLTKLKEKNKKEKNTGVGVVPFVGDSSTGEKEKWRKVKNADGDWVMVLADGGDED